MKQMFSRVLLLLLVLAVPGAAQTPEEAGRPAPPAGGYRLGPMDGLNIAVWGHSELTGKFTVASDGTLAFPLVGAVKAANRTVAELQNELTVRLADGFLKNPSVTILVEQYASQRIFVMGEVSTPGPVPLTGPMTVLEVLARAGSLTEQAGGELVILRNASSNGSPAAPGEAGASEVGRMSVSKLRRGEVAANLALQNGDTVFVPRAENVFVLGLVNKPGAITLESGLTVLHALSLAGGTSGLGSTGRIKIVRVINGKRTEIKAKLDDLLQPGDTVTVGARRF